MPIEIKRAKGTVELCTDMALQEAWEVASERLRAAQSVDTQMLNNATLGEAAQAVQAIEKQMEDSILVFALEAMPRKLWQEHEANHPPREGQKDDETFSVNCSTFFDATVPASITGVTQKSTGEPFEFDPAVEWSALADEMSDAQYNVFALKILNLNRGKTGVPFSPAASRLTAGSDAS